VCEQLAQSRYLAVHQARVDSGTFLSPVWPATVTPLSHIKQSAVCFLCRESVGEVETERVGGELAEQQAAVDMSLVTAGELCAICYNYRSVYQVCREGEG